MPPVEQPFPRRHRSTRTTTMSGPRPSKGKSKAVATRNAARNKPCHLWRTSGVCRFGTRCKFRHVESEKGSLQVNSAVDGKEKDESETKPATPRFVHNSSAPLPNGDAKPGPSGSNIAPVNVPPSVSVKSSEGRSDVYNVSNFPVKAIVCREWKRNGKCAYGAECRFGHPIQINAENGETIGEASNVQKSSPKATVQGRGTIGKKKAKIQKRAEEERLAKEKLERENQEKRIKTEEEAKERRERAEREKLERERLERERLERERLAREKLERERLAREKRERDRLERERLERERLERERLERERLERERLERERLERENEEKRIKAEEEAKERKERAESQRKAAEEKRKKKEAARQKKAEAAQLKREECKLRKQAQKKRAQEMEQARLQNEERLAREKAEREAAMREQMKARREMEAAAIEQYIVSESSLVTFAAGLNIQGVVSGFDLCRITIKNLPSDAKAEEIADIFAQQGVASTEYFVLELKPTHNGAKREAVVVANVDQGQNIAIGLEGIEFRDETLTFEVSENASWNGMSTAAQNTPFLTVSWWAPSETIIATYESEEQARKQIQRLNGKTWNGRRIRAMLNNHPNAARFFTSLHEVKILGCAPDTWLDTEFFDFVDSYDIRLLSAASHNLDDVFHHVREHLRNCPGVQMHTYEVLNNGTQIDAEARIKVGFDEWEDAKRAHDTMDKKRLLIHNFPLLRSWLPKPLQYSIKIPRQQFQAQKSQWDELSEKKPGRDAHVQTKVGDRGDVFIRVLGQDKKAAGSLKVRVEGMAAGEKLDATHWHPSFGFPRGNAFLNRIFGEKQVYIRNDFKARCLRACGEPTRIEEAKQMIKGEVDRLAGMETTRVMDPACVRGFMREGLGKLKELIGDDNVTVNIASAPFRVTVKGGVEATHHLQRLMDEARMIGALDEALPGDTDRETCPICTDDVSNGEQLGCGHAYCSGCLSHFLTSAVDNKNFPLACMGNGGACQVPFPIPSIRRFLPPQLFENLVEAAFATYLEQHSQELKYCTTPDCKQIYRRRSDKTLLKCPACFSTICPMCDEEAHEGMTCQERRIHRDPGLQDRLTEEFAREHGYKNCPQCRIFIEKTEGCNHMTCKCGAHICWRCMGIFTANTIYPHMQSAHNGIYDTVPGGANNDDIFGANDDAAAMAAQMQELARFERQREVAQYVRAVPANPFVDDRQERERRARIAEQEVQRRNEARHQWAQWAWLIDEQDTQRINEERARQARARQTTLDAQETERRRDEERARQERQEQARRAELLATQRRAEEDRGWCIVM
ncbi:hypothetical protein BDN70DRAFT_990656 [Pholiota conissans]|uniref:RBR-type E3 ubiquitin transferase n=1 Tax=Pholiota conissans TaxID=109636 RepID=A0A9P5ZBQ7_9AGAR|nr:hypothetical protein BDN70DRAFT_990656 [Pholiota conissans]